MGGPGSGGARPRTNSARGPARPRATITLSETNYTRVDNILKTRGPEWNRSRYIDYVLDQHFEALLGSADASVPIPEPRSLVEYEQDVAGLPVDNLTFELISARALLRQGLEEFEYTRRAVLAWERETGATAPTMLKDPAALHRSLETIAKLANAQARINHSKAVTQEMVLGTVIAYANGASRSIREALRERLDGRLEPEDVLEITDYVVNRVETSPPAVDSRAAAAIGLPDPDAEG